MNGNVFQCFAEQRDRRQYEKTVEALEGYTKKTLNTTKILPPTFSAGT